MRCPKCGFISFDHLEACKKCHKPLGATTAEVHGTTYDAAVPLFLTIASADERTAPQAGQQSGAQEVSTFADESGFELGENAEDEFLLDQEFEAEPQRKEIEFPGSETELVMDFDAIAEVAPRGEGAFEGAENADASSSSMPSLDFGDLDISDLAPPVREQPEPLRVEEQPEAHDLEPVAAISPIPPSSPAPATKSSGLEDLNFNGLDLETSAKPVSGSAAGKRLLPSVKTGTALDTFDIDLGDLFSDHKK